MSSGGPGRGEASKVAALVGVMAALYYAFLWLPGIPVIGLPQIKIDIGASFASILGIVLGPYLGFLAALVGNIAKVSTPPDVYGLPFILCAAFNALVASYVVRGKWKVPVVVFVVMMLVALATPVFSPLTAYWYEYTLAYFDKIIALALTPIAAYLARSSSKAHFHAALLLAVFIGSEADAAVGCTVFALPPVYNGLFGLSAEVTRSLYTVSPLIYPATYLVRSLVAYVIALPLLHVLSRVSGLREFLGLEGFEGKV